MKRKLVCFCEHKFEADIPDRVDLGADPALEEAILQGEFMTVRCPGCGKLLKPEYPVRVEDPAAGLAYFLVPELDRGAYLRGASEYDLEGADRVVIGYDELAEKIRIRRAGLDDRVVELLKYYLLNKILEGEEAEAEGEVRIFFSRTEGQSLVFHAVGLKENEVGVLKVPTELAAKISGQLEERRGQEPYATILRGPYVSVNALYGEERQ
ncbi:MAG: CpXC domain-containing protein [Spirochaetales bacterium]|nr:CpXC domain-containing protein [Spirochaetales bacterium]